MTHSTVCPACDAGTPIAVGQVSGYVEGLEYEIGACDFCGSQTALTTHPIPEGLYEAIYTNASELHGYSRYVRHALMVERARYPLYMLATMEPAYWAVRSILHQRRRDDQGTRVLEVGSGLGYITAALRAAGFDATGVDLSAQATAEATRRFGSWYRTGDVTDPKTLNGAYDVVVGLEILEHVGTPRELVRGLLPLLTANGEVVVSTPNRDQYRSDTLWATDLPPVHLHWFSELGMRSLCPPGARAELFDFTAYNHRFGWPSDLRARSGRGRAFLDESLALTDPIPQATLPPWYRRAKHHPASYPLVVGTHRMRETVRSLQDLRKPHRKAIIQYRTSAIVARYSNSLGSSVAD